MHSNKGAAKLGEVRKANKNDNYFRKCDIQWKAEGFGSGKWKTMWSRQLSSKPYNSILTKPIIIYLKTLIRVFNTK